MTSIIPTHDGTAASGAPPPRPPPAMHPAPAPAAPAGATPTSHMTAAPPTGPSVGTEGSGGYAQPAGVFAEGQQQHQSRSIHHRGYDGSGIAAGFGQNPETYEPPKSTLTPPPRETGGAGQVKENSGQKAARTVKGLAAQGHVSKSRCECGHTSREGTLTKLLVVGNR